MKRGLIYKGSMMISFEKEPYKTRALLQRRRGACVCISSKHSELYNGVWCIQSIQKRAGVLQCVAVCCSALQSAAMCCRVLQCVAECCSVLQCAAVRSSVLQCLVKTCLWCQEGVSCTHSSVSATPSIRMTKRIFLRTWFLKKTVEDKERLSSNFASMHAYSHPHPCPNSQPRHPPK